MKRALAWLAGLVGIAALGRALTRRRHPAEKAVPEHPLITGADATAAGDPADELRRKLAAQRQPGQDAGPAAAAPDETLEERRTRVHAKAREAINAMHDDEPAA